MSVELKSFDGSPAGAHTQSIGLARNALAPPASLWCFGADGSFRWSFRTKPQINGLVVNDGAIYLLTAEMVVHKISADGRELWSTRVYGIGSVFYQIDSAAMYARPSGGVVVCISFRLSYSNGGRLYWVDSAGGTTEQVLDVACRYISHDSDGTSVYCTVTAAGVGNVERWDATGQVWSVDSGYTSPSNITVHAGYVFVYNGLQLVRLLPADGSYDGTVSGSGWSGPEFQASMPMRKFGSNVLSHTLVLGLGTTCPFSVHSGVGLAPVYYATPGSSPYGNFNKTRFANSWYDPRCVPLSWGLASQKSAVKVEAPERFFNIGISGERTAIGPDGSMLIAGGPAIRWQQRIRTTLPAPALTSSAKFTALKVPPTRPLPTISAGAEVTPFERAP